MNSETNQREFTPAALLKRLTKFKNYLFDIVRKCHQV
jgi:hypothetical protein